MASPIQLSDHFTAGRLLRFTLPTMGMMVFASIYGVVDGLFVSNFVGKQAFVAVNLIFPFLMIMASCAFMLGTGGSALVSKTLGEGRTEAANRRFSMLVCTAALLGLVLTGIGLLGLGAAARGIGAEGAVLEDCLLYGRILLPALPFMMLQVLFQNFFSVAERPKLGFLVTVAAGCTNIVLDALFIIVFGWGLAGAAFATVLGNVAGAVLPLFYFLRRDCTPLRLVRPAYDGRALLKACTNGSSELMTNLSMSMVSALYNWQLLRLVGENGVAAYGVVMYASFIFISLLLGFSFGSIPVIGYHFGARNYDELKNLFRTCIGLSLGLGIALTTAAWFISPPLAEYFVGYDAELTAYTVRAFRLYVLSFLVVGVCMFGSSFFTALNNGLVSAAISFFRTLVAEVAAVLLLPILFGAESIWLAVSAAELAALAATIWCFRRFATRYHYL